MTRPQRLVLLATILASGLGFLDGSVVNVGLPAIGRSLGGNGVAEGSALQWVVNAYLLPLGALLLAGGAAGDRFGRRRLLVAGTALFAAASLLCTVAPGLRWLWAGRLLQGVGAAVLLPNSLAILGDTFAGPEKGRAVGIWAASGAAFAAVGPPLGGTLIDWVGWRAVFALNLPLAAAATALALRAVPSDAHENDKGPALDWPGALLATAGLGLLTAGLTEGAGSAGWTPGPLASLASGAALLAAFVAWEARVGETAMMPLGLFGSARLAGLTLLTFLVYGALGGMFVLLPFLLVEGASYSATAAGLSLLPIPVLLAALSPFVGRWAGRVGTRPFLAGGSAGAGLGLLLTLRIGPGAAYWTEVLPGVLAVAAGVGIAVAPLTAAVLDATDAQHTGSASGLNSAVARTGTMVATALMGAVLAARGPALFTAFHAAALAGTAACLGAALSAWWLLRERRT